MKKFFIPVGLWLFIFFTIIALSCSKKLQPKTSANILEQPCETNDKQI